MKGKPLSEDARRILLYMAISHQLSAQDVADWTGIPLRTVQRVVSQYRMTGDVILTRDVETRGRKRVLEYEDLKVRYPFH